MIRWGEPLWLIALVLPVALLVFELIVGRLSDRARKRFASLHLWPHLAPTRSPRLRRIKRLLFIAALVFLVVGLANPRVGTRFEEVTREGLDIFLLVDVSKSMDTRDIRPSRIAKTRYELLQFLKGLKGDRIGLIPFAGSAYTVCPLTLDYSAAAMFIDLLSTELIPNPGTNLAAAIETALASFGTSEDEAERGKVILVISDGEDHEGGAVEAARKAHNKGVRIYTVGMALAKGDPIPLFDAQGEQSGWKMDDEGHIVTSRLNEDILRDIAMAGGGQYRRAGQGGEAFKAIYRKIFNLDRSELSQKRITGYEDRFQWFLLAALLLLLAEFILPLGAIKLRKATLLPLLIGLVLVGLSASDASAQKAHRLVKEGNNEVSDGDVEEALTKYLEARTTRDSLRPELLYDLGGAYARMGDLQRADSLLQNLPEDADSTLRSRAHYNRGSAFAEAQQYEPAVDAFIQALQYNPRDIDAKVNLEVALRRMQQQQQQQQQQNQDQQDNEDQQDQEQQQNQDQQDQQDDQQQQQQDQQDQQDQEQQQQQQPKPEEMPPEMAQRFLDKLQQDEKELLQELVRQQVPVEKQKTKKDW